MSTRLVVSDVPTAPCESSTSVAPYSPHTDDRGLLLPVRVQTINIFNCLHHSKWKADETLRCTQRIRSQWIFPIETIHILVCVCLLFALSLSLSFILFPLLASLFCVCADVASLSPIPKGKGFFPFFLHDVSAITYWIVGIHKRSCTENERVTKEKAEGGSFKMNEKDFCISPFFFFRIDKTPDTIVCTRTSRYGTILRLPIFVGIPAFVSVFFGYSSTLLVFT